MAASQSFRFLDLPKELRFMVYERIPVTKHHYEVRRTYIWTVLPEWCRGAEVTLVIGSLPVALLATCRVISAEATSFLKPKLDKLSQEPLRLMFDNINWNVSPLLTGVCVRDIRYWHRQYVSIHRHEHWWNKSRKVEVAVRSNVVESIVDSRLLSILMDIWQVAVGSRCQPAITFKGIWKHSVTDSFLDDTTMEAIVEKARCSTWHYIPQLTGEEWTLSWEEDNSH